MERNINEIKLNQKINEILNLIKDFRAGSTSDNDNELVVNYLDSQFILSIKEVPKIDNIFTAIDKYLR